MAGQQESKALISQTIMNPNTVEARREFIKFLAASPYVAMLGGVSAFLPQSASELITDPAKALNVFDFEEVAHRKVMPGHWAYMASGVDDDATLRANREGFRHVQLRPRRLLGDRHHGRQPPRPQQRDIPPHSSKGSDPVLRVPQRRARSRHE